MEVDETTSEISLHAIFGAHVPQTTHVKGIMGWQVVMVLVDSGSTHNSLYNNITKKVRLLPSNERHFEVVGVVQRGLHVVTRSPCHFRYSPSLTRRL